MLDASPRSLFQRKISRHCSFTLIECHPSSFPLSFSNRFPGGDRRSASPLASSTICSFRNRDAERPAGTLRLARSSRKKSRSHLSRKLRIISVRRLYHCTVLRYNALASNYCPPSSSATRFTIRCSNTTLKLMWLARSGTNSVTKLPIGALAQPLAMRSAPGPHPIL